MRASRLLSMLILLQMRGRQSAAALAGEFETSVRTIYRDVDALSAAGVPVYAERGRNGGIALRDGWRTRLTGLSLTESEALLLAGAGDAATALGMRSDAAAAQLKILASLPDDSRASAQRIGSRFHLDPIPWYHRVERMDCLPSLANAVWRDQRVRIDYESWNDRVTRTIDPLGLVLKGGIWYVIGAVAQRPRTFRVANIHRLELTGERFPRPKRFDLAKHWAQSAREFESRLMGARATVLISEEGRRILRAMSPAAAEIVETSQRSARRKGWIEADYPIESVAYSAKQLLRFGTELEVISPSALRQAVAREAQAVVQAYRAESRPAGVTRARTTSRPRRKTSRASASAAARGRRPGRR